MHTSSIKIDDNKQNAQEYDIKQAYKKVEQDMAGQGQLFPAG